MNTATPPARYLGIGAIIYGIVSAVWLIWEYTFGTVQNLVVLGVGFAAILVLIALAARFIMQSPAPVTDENDKTGMWFGIIFAWEGIGIAVASGILAALGYVNWIGVAIVIIVGLHFFPLGWLLRQTTDYAIGTVLLLIGILVPLLIAEPANWFTVIAFGAALTLYAAGWMRLWVGRRLL